MTKSKPKKPVKSKKQTATPTKFHQMMAFVSSPRHRSIFRVIALWLASYLVLMSFLLRTVLNNYSYIEIFPKELIIPTLIHVVTATIITLIFYRLPWLKTFGSKLFSATVLALLLINYDSNLLAISGLIRAFIPGYTDTDPLALVSLVYLILLVVLAVFIGIGLERLAKKVKQLQPKDIELGVMVLVIYLFIVPAFSFSKILPSLIRESRTQAPQIPGQTTSSFAEDKPDIYYIVLDRYTNADVLKKQFNYDNSPFTGFLRGQDFYVNDNAYGNYPYTTMSISSTLNAQYTNQLVAPYKNSTVQSHVLYHNLIWQSSVVKALKKDGYKYYAIGSWYGASYKAPLADRDYMYDHELTLFGHTKRLRGIEATEFEKSPYYRFAQLPNISWWPAKVADNSGVDDVRQQLNILDDLSTKEKPGGRFIFAHILVPHDPFLFNGDGSLSIYPSSDSVGKPIKDKYVGQVEFINSQMKELVNNIQKQSGGKAVVIFNSDEGPYPQILNDTFKHPTGISQADTEAAISHEDMRTWSDDYFKMKFGVLQAVHIPNATADDLAHLSSVNVFRIVLNRYVGYSLDYLPECHYGLISGNQYEYDYADITKHFVASPDPSCKQMQSLPTKNN